MSRVILTPLRPTVRCTSLLTRLSTATDALHNIQFSVAGPKGDTGRGITWKGDYDELTAYIALDGVVYNGSSYICDVACTGIIPTTEANWSILAAAAGEWDILDLGSFV